MVRWVGLMDASLQRRDEVIRERFFEGKHRQDKHNINSNMIQTVRVFVVKRGAKLEGQGLESQWTVLP